MLHSFTFVRSSFKPVRQLTLCHTNQWRNTSSISALQAAFRDPSSPFHIPPGEKGPESPDAPPSHATLRTLATMENTMDPLEEAQEKLSSAGFDPASFWEQRIVWGDHDSFQHVNNVRYVRFFESGRIKWMTSLGEELGGHARTIAMLKGQGVSLILKSIEVQYRRPVTYPDTLLIGYRPVPASLSTDVEDPATFYVAASAYSLAQKAFVAHAKEALVWYDYDKLKKCDPGEHAREVIAGRVRKQ
ncbi:Thioesterase/thiol ester dehydrase-isomerase [Crucibulum laeve]|uniref:Thioesterase/thiol ester dehydrase-isomerase n=1 Tax=Crucibulum laeve TaxID=68775 RepID=A0A5C3M3A5_9AGAR|nr:Thioesterase/thiol ester dehydrase-isomerase [Crucibulum laeve]